MTAMIPTFHGGPWTEEEYLALGEDNDRVELHDGDLYVTAAPSLWHQHVCGELYVALRTAARSSGHRAYLGVNLRLQPGRIMIPDLTIMAGIDFYERVAPASAARLVCEVTSPSNASNDRVLKMHHYAQAGIPWYLMVEHATSGLRLFRLEGETYELYAVAGLGEVLRLHEPVTAEIRPESLLP
jgi:Uma2 family endonuclease